MSSSAVEILMRQREGGRLFEEFRERMMSEIVDLFTVPSALLNDMPPIIRRDWQWRTIRIPRRTRSPDMAQMIEDIERADVRKVVYRWRYEPVATWPGSSIPMTWAKRLDVIEEPLR